jgi:chorismate--pyruvate lyase
VRQGLTVPSIADANLTWKSSTEHFPRPSKKWRNWLLDPGSLTRRLVEQSHGNFHVNLISECWETQHSPYLLKVLGRPCSVQRMWSRKVVLCGHQQPWVTAHTLVPQASFKSPLRRIKKLQSKPLGAFLFSHPNLQRSRMDIVKCGDSWGRCSKFLLYGEPILVAEFFDPALIEFS